MDAVTEWVEGDCRKVSNGDHVKIISGEQVLVGRFAICEAGYAKVRSGNGPHNNCVPVAGARLFVPAAPKAALPTAGFYTSSNLVYEIRDDEPRIRCVSFDKGTWRYSNGYMGVLFTRLEPVADTAKAVLAALTNEVHTGGMGTGSYSEFKRARDIIAAEFGVTL